ncbi:MAG: hypothetical protein IJA29_09480 [Lachnospiraceae bacterium]|nr:hypothetical protein [Lachnospiraceae bacterium]
MYLRNKAILIYKIKNVIFNVIGCLWVLGSTWNILALISTYWNDWETVLYANSFLGSVIRLPLAAILLLIAGISKRWIEDAVFYSGYFEGNLDGYVSFTELEKTTGIPSWWIRVQLGFFPLLYMKNYKVQSVNNKATIVLNSKTTTCECRNCGAIIEKKEYFTGSCKYCGSSDLFARVLTKDGFYSISNERAKESHNISFYNKKSYPFMKLLFFAGPMMGVAVMVICLFMSLDNASKVNDEDYIKEYQYEMIESGQAPPTAENIQNDLKDLVIMGIMTMLVLTPVVIIGFTRSNSVMILESCGYFFERCKQPFVNIMEVPIVRKRMYPGMGIRTIRRAMRFGYLKNCTLDMNEGNLRVALARKIVKDACPHCNAPIVGAVDANYICKYCGKTIMGVVERK